MKIQKSGTVPKTQKAEVTPPWWLGKRAECPKCGAVVVLEISDAPSHYTSFALRCPTKDCGTYIQIRPMYDRSGMIG